MAKILRVFPLIFLISFDSSNKIRGNNSVVIGTYSDEDIYDKTIKWHDIFEMTPHHYYVYFYSPYCGHCQSIKDLVINYSMFGNVTMFFVEANREVTVAEDTYLTIGATSIEQLWILGYPSLIEIESGLLIANIAGANAIKEILLI
ncbi:MAG: hypothetical protein GX816_02610 [Erysipelotrichia bacterium]|nr:hypothetical protein [Erysipelotrichia bacterium]